MSEKGIYLEVKRIKGVTDRLGPLHAYLVYRDGKGGERVIRGGPGPWTDFFSGGDIQVEVDVPLDQSQDRYEADEKRGSRPSKKLDLGSRSEEEVWAAMVKEGRRIHAGKMDYDIFPFQNSNSVARALVKAGGIDAAKALPEGRREYAWPLDQDVTGMTFVEGGGELPGFGNDLSDPYDLIDRLRGLGGRGAKGEPAPSGTATPAPSPSSMYDQSGRRGNETFGLARMAGPSRRPYEVAMAKPVADWTDDDARAVMTARIGNPMTDAERTVMAEREREFFRRRFGDGPARYDATGRLMPAAVSGSSTSGRRTNPFAGLLGFL